MSLKYEMYRDGKDLVIVGSVLCRSCGRIIEEYETCLYLESWHHGYGFNEAVVCDVGCSITQLDLRVGKYYQNRVLIVESRPEGSVRKMPEPPEYTSTSDLTEASSYFSDGEKRYHSNVNKAQFMDMGGKKPLIPAQDAKGVALSDLRDAQNKGTLPTMEEDLAELELIFSATPIDAHTQVESDEKKRIGGK